MNFLAHSLISLEIDEKANKKTLYGNFAGDFYKGRVDKIELPEELKEGIVLHRMIDGISDRNENLLNELLVEKFGIFKGIVSDMIIDHFLAKNFDRLFNENINNIEKKILYNVSKNKSFFPKKFAGTFKWIESEKIMSNYKYFDFLERAFFGISQRLRKGEILRLAVRELEISKAAPSGKESAEIKKYDSLNAAAEDYAKVLQEISNYGSRKMLKSINPDVDKYVAKANNSSLKKQWEDSNTMLIEQFEVSVYQVNENGNNGEVVFLVKGYDEKALDKYLGDNASKYVTKVDNSKDEVEVDIEKYIKLQYNYLKSTKKINLATSTVKFRKGSDNKWQVVK